MADNNGEFSNCLTHFVDNGSVESHRYYLARKTLFELLNDRGYAVPNSELTRSLPEFRAEFGQKPDPLSLRICVPLRVDSSSKILVTFGGTEEIKKGNIFTIFSQVIHKEILHRIILVLQSKMNHHARKVVDEYPVKTEIFQISDLLVNITKHVLTPKHEKLTTQEKTCLLQKYQVKEHQLPRIQENDAIARYHGHEKGQVMKVGYTAGLPSSLVTYRCVL
ncbi:DNA-directed RNA polymerase V subunit 5C-like [Chenopodium quinoa]|uniref:DNA-directed RNA polymerase V subunit 5C-like n=1 Tax=Chenopodium quinoa TaxID=63459 RepID=UPI000B798CC0|nr:DNA-directed RNA polymerase V subunit 5C-like [Chenopodium quinoa]